MGSACFNDATKATGCNRSWHVIVVSPLPHWWRVCNMKNKIVLKRKEKEKKNQHFHQHSLSSKHTVVETYVAVADDRRTIHATGRMAMGTDSRHGLDPKPGREKQFNEVNISGWWCIEIKWIPLYMYHGGWFISWNKTGTKKHDVNTLVTNCAQLVAGRLKMVERHCLHT